MSDRVKIVDVTGKRFINCPYCGCHIDVPPRTLNMEKLKHMQSVKRLAEWHKRQEIHGIGNARALTCPSCSQTIICSDEFSVKV